MSVYTAVEKYLAKLNSNFPTDPKISEIRWRNEMQSAFIAGFMACELEGAARCEHPKLQKYPKHWFICGTADAIATFCPDCGKRLEKEEA